LTLGVGRAASSAQRPGQRLLERLGPRGQVLPVQPLAAQELTQFGLRELALPNTTCARSRAVQSGGRFGSAELGMGGADGGFTGPTPLILAASRSHRDNVGCAIPVSSSSLLALTAFGPGIRRTIAPSRSLRTPSVDSALVPLTVVGHQLEPGNYADTGGRHGLLLMRPGHR
jgi:hypothetical protein